MSLLQADPPFIDVWLLCKMVDGCPHGGLVYLLTCVLIAGWSSCHWQSFLLLPRTSCCWWILWMRPAAVVVQMDLGRSPAVPSRNCWPITMSCSHHGCCWCARHGGKTRPSPGCLQVSTGGNVSLWHAWRCMQISPDQTRSYSTSMTCMCLLCNRPRKSI